jgi:hypothetical protein
MVEVVLKFYWLPVGIRLHNSNNVIHSLCCIVPVSEVGIILCVKMVEKAGNKADHNNGYPVVCTIFIPRLKSVAAVKASSKSFPQIRLRVGSQLMMGRCQ